MPPPSPPVAGAASRKPLWPTEAALHSIRYGAWKRVSPAARSSIWPVFFNVLGELERLETLLATGTDEVGLLMMDESLPQRVRVQRSRGAL